MQYLPPSTWAVDGSRYRQHSPFEPLLNRLKEVRRLTTHYGENANSYLDFMQFAHTLSFDLASFYTVYSTRKIQKFIWRSYGMF